MTSYTHPKLPRPAPVLHSSINQPASLHLPPAVQVFCSHLVVSTYVNTFLSTDPNSCSSASRRRLGNYYSSPIALELAQTSVFLTHSIGYLIAFLSFKAPRRPPAVYEGDRGRSSHIDRPPVTSILEGD
uniref:Uncharacterized protein n=1 Tax=Bionectria ochroleuca TaxID=29856 RepID=A0A8H7NDF6_BIOOC